jgi:hypothetical protein
MSTHRQHKRVLHVVEHGHDASHLLWRSECDAIMERVSDAWCWHTSLSERVSSNNSFITFAQRTDSHPHAHPQQQPCNAMARRGQQQRDACITRGSGVGKCHPLKRQRKVRTVDRGARRGRRAASKKIQFFTRVLSTTCAWCPHTALWREANRKSNTASERKSRRTTFTGVHSWQWPEKKEMHVGVKEDDTLICPKTQTRRGSSTSRHWQQNVVERTAALAH